MRFTPKSEDELSTGSGFEPFPAGEYPFEVMEATEEVSKSSGLPMVKLNIAIYNDEGRKRFVYDYLSSSEKALFKVLQFAVAVGMLDNYERGELMPEDMVGRTGKCRVAIEKQEGYEARNKIAAYVKPALTQRKPSMFKPKKAQPVYEDLSDEVPF